MLGYLLLFLSLFGIECKIKNYRKKMFLCFWTLSLFSGLRYGVGYDYFMYYEFIEDNFLDREPIPALFTYIAHNTHFSFFFILTSLFTNYFFVKGLEVRKCSMDSVYFYVGFPLFFFFSLSTVRQAMAYSVIFYMMCGKRNHWGKNLLLLFIAFLCHRSALVAVLLFLPTDRIGKKILCLIFGTSLVIGEYILKYLFSLNLDFNLLMQFQSFIESEFEGGYFKRILVYCMTFLVLVYYNKLNSSDKENHKFIVWTCIGGSLYALFNISSHVAERFCSFYFVAILILIPTLYRRMRIPKVIYRSLLVIMFAASVYVAYHTSLQDNQWSKYRKELYYPYKTIFEK